MTDVPSKADTPRACSLKVSSEFFWFRLVPAALINAVLITVCMVAVCCFAIIIDVNVRASAGPKLVSVLFQLAWMCTAALAPLWYAMSWRWLGFRQSPGEEWLHPTYFTASLHCPLIIFAMSVLVLWLVISTLIVRFWDSPYSTLVYLLCFILPICGVIVSLPALRTCVH